MAAGVEEAAELDWDGEGAAVKGLEEAHDHADGDRQRGVAGGATAAAAGGREGEGRGGVWRPATRWKERWRRQRREFGRRRMRG
jgi:hypothetical protein